MMFGDYQNERDRKKAIIAMLIRMVAIDENVAPMESRFVADVAASMHLNSDDIAEVIKNPQDFPLDPPADEQERMKILYYLLFTMRVDGQIQPSEEKLCYKAGLSLGFNELLTNDLIGVMKTYLTDEIPPDAMLEKIRKYLN